MKFLWNRDPNKRPLSSVMCCDDHSRKAPVRGALLNICLTLGHVWPPLYLCLPWHCSQFSPRLICSSKFHGPCSNRTIFVNCFGGWKANLEVIDDIKYFFSQVNCHHSDCVSLLPCTRNIQTLSPFPTILALERGMTLFLGPTHCPYLQMNDKGYSELCLPPCPQPYTPHPSFLVGMFSPL